MIVNGAAVSYTRPEAKKQHARVAPLVFGCADLLIEETDVD